MSTVLPKIFGVPLSTGEGLPPAEGGVYPIPTETAAPDPKKKTGIYLDESGTEHTVEIISTNRDGSHDVIFPNEVGGYRKDGVRLVGDPVPSAKPDSFSQPPVTKEPDSDSMG